MLRSHQQTDAEVRDEVRYRRTRIREGQTSGLLEAGTASRGVRPVLEGAEGDPEGRGGLRGGRADARGPAQGREVVQAEVTEAHQRGLQGRVGS